MNKEKSDETQVTMDEDSNIAILAKELAKKTRLDDQVHHEVLPTSREIVLEAEAEAEEDSNSAILRLINEMTVPMADDDIHEDFHLKRFPKEHGIRRNVPEWDHEDAQEAQDHTQVGEEIVSILPGIETNSRVSSSESQHKTRSLRKTLRDTLKLKKKGGKNNWKSGSGEVLHNSGEDDAEAEASTAAAPKRNWLRRVFSRK